MKNVLIKTAQCIGTKNTARRQCCLSLLNPEYKDDKLKPCFYELFPKKTSSESLKQASRIKAPLLMGWISDLDNLRNKLKLIRHWRAEPNKSFDHELLPWSWTYILTKWIFLTKFMSNLLLLTYHYLLWGFAAIRQLCCSLTHLTSFNVVCSFCLPHVFLSSFLF